jgi:TetR/AcrR family transcriptional regulator, copper-responsive repressor
MTAARRPTGRPPQFDRDSVLESAMLVFWAHGYEGASLAILTAAMRLSPASFYAAFGSKEALYRETLRRYGGGPAAPDHGTNGAYRELERRLKQAAKRFTQPGKPPGCMMLTGSLRGGGDAGGAVAATAETRATHLASMVRLFEQAKADDELPPDCDPRALAHFYMAVLQGMSVQAIDGASVKTLNQIAEQALEQWPGKGR